MERGDTVRVEAVDGPPEGAPVAYTYWFALSALMEVQNYLATHAYSIHYTDYDWSLNEQ